MRDDAQAWRHARAQQLLITLAQLLDCGFSHSAVRHRVRRGRLFRVFPGVFAVGYREMTPQRLAMAAALACGDVSAAARRTAAAHLGLSEESWPSVPQVVVPRRSWTRGPQGVDLVPSRTLTADEIEAVDGVRVTHLMRTIADNAAIETRRGLKTMIRHAQRQHGLDLDALLAYAQARPPTSFRHARIKRVLAEYLAPSALTDTEREALVMELCATNRIPLPETQIWIAGYRVDFVWQSERLVLELDDRWSHDNPFRFVDDRARDRALLLAGYVVMRFAVEEVLRNPVAVARQIRAALAGFAAA